MEPSSTPPGPGNTDEADRAFARYCTSGDPGDLAQTFEATAPELLRVARHLTPDAATAEDVLQATFLAAIESRGRFEQDQRVRPWLCGILEHKAKEIARRERRVIDTDRLPEQLSSTPIDAAEHSELHGAIDDAMSELGETYRAVLHPYLTAGKSARAIAESLRRPAGTVRTQIVRGLEKLRQTLPVGLAGALTAWVLPERGLAAVQQAVTHHAQTVAASTTVAATVAAAAAGGGATATKTTVATTGGILLMKKLLFPAFLGLLSYGTYSLLTPPADPPPETGTVAADVDPATGESDADTTSASVPALPSTSASTKRKEVEPILASDDGTTISGRVVHENGSVLADVRVVAWNSHLYTVQRDGRYEDAPTTETTTNTAGEFTLKGLGDKWTVSAISETAHALIRLKGESEDRPRLDGLEVVMADTTILRGRILDADGEPMANQPISNPFSSSSSSADRTALAKVFKQRPDLHTTTTGADGNFTVRCIANINYRWLSKHAHHPVWQQVHRAADGPLEVRFERGEDVRGRVWLPNGSPAVDATVTLIDTPKRVRITDQEGRFAIQGADLDEDSKLHVFHAQAAIHITAPVPGGVAEIEVKLEQPQSITGQVLDGSSNPVLGARVYVIGDRQSVRKYVADKPPTWEHQHDCDETTTDAEGAFELTQLYSGRFEVRAYPPGEKRAFVSAMTDSGAGPLTLRLDPAALRKTALLGTVVDAATGEPIPKFDFTIYRETADGSYGQVDSGTNGRFERVGFEPGLLHVGVKATGYASFESAQQDYILGDHYMEVRLHRTTDVTFAVTDERGLPANAKLRFSTPDGRSIWIPTPMGSTTGVTVSKDKPEHLVSGLPATTIVVEVIRAPLPPTRRQIDLSAEWTGPVPLMVRSLPEQISFGCAIAEHDRDWTPPAKLTSQMKPVLMQAFADKKVGHLQTGATLRVETADGILICRGKITRLPTKPGSSEEPRFKTATSMVHNGQQGGSSGEMPGSMISLWGIAGPMRLFVDIEGRESKEISIDGTQLADLGPRPFMVWVPR